MKAQLVSSLVNLRMISLVRCVTLALPIAACSDSAGPREDPDPVGQVIVTLPQLGLAVGFSTQATDTVKDANGAVLTDRTVTWSSSNTAVARVTQAGVVTAVARGVAEITATSGEKSGSATIGVVAIKPQSLSVSNAHVCAISVTGDMYCWGSNYLGELGNREERSHAIPTLVEGGLKFLAVSTTPEATYALATDGRFYCWGMARTCDPNASTRVANQRGGWPVIFAPWPVPTTRAIEVLSSNEGRCAVAVMNVAHCWGANTHGERGTGAASSDTIYAPDPPVIGNHAFAEISVGSHVCGITTAGIAYCWGNGALGALGDGSGTSSAAPRRVAGNAVFKSIGAGAHFTCGLTTGGEVYCWGVAAAYAPGSSPGPCLGQVEGPCSATPIAAAPGHVFESLNVNFHNVCGVKSGGDIYCWGSHWAATPVPFRSTLAHEPGGVRFRTVSIGGVNACGVTDAGDIYCRGYNNWGQLGNGGILDVFFYTREPTLVTGGIKFRAP